MTHSMAVIGCGYWGPNLVRNFRSLPGVKVAVICDKSPERLDHPTLWMDCRSAWQLFLQKEMESSVK
jgi:predicted dehydrogenase